MHHLVRGLAARHGFFCTLPELLYKLCSSIVFIRYSFKSIIKTRNTQQKNGNIGNKVEGKTITQYVSLWHHETQISEIKHITRQHNTYARPQDTAHTTQKTKNPDTRQCAKLPSAHTCVINALLKKFTRT